MIWPALGAPNSTEIGFNSNARYKLQTGDLETGDLITGGAQTLQNRAAGSKTVAQAFPSVETSDQKVWKFGAPCNLNRTVISVEA